MKWVDDVDEVAFRRNTNNMANANYALLHCVGLNMLTFDGESTVDLMEAGGTCDGCKRLIDKSTIHNRPSTVHLAMDGECRKCSSAMAIHTAMIKR